MKKIIAAVLMTCLTIGFAYADEDNSIVDQGMLRSKPANYYVLKQNEERPEGLQSDPSKKYQKVGLGSIKDESVETDKAEETKDSIESAPQYSLENLGYSKEEIEQKGLSIEWYRVKQEKDGWHVDGQVVERPVIEQKPEEPVVEPKEEIVIEHHSHKKHHDKKEPVAEKEEVVVEEITEEDVPMAELPDVTEPEEKPQVGIEVEQIVVEQMPNVDAEVVGSGAIVKVPILMDDTEIIEQIDEDEVPLAAAPQDNNKEKENLYFHFRDILICLFTVSISTVILLFIVVWKRDEKKEED